MWNPFKHPILKNSEPEVVYKEMQEYFNIQEISPEPWVCIPSGTPVQWREAYYAGNSGTSSVAPQYTISNILKCEYCGTRNVVDNLKVMNCACCGAPL